MESPKMLVNLKEQYITPLVLPREQAACWLKWNKDADFEKIILRYEPDVDILRLFNVDESIFKNKNEWHGTIEISKSMIQINGFFGFTAFGIIPIKDEKNISYYIDFVKEDKKQTVVMTNKIITPQIEIVKSSQEQIVVSKISPLLQPLEFELRSRGVVAVKNLTLHVNVNTSNNLKAKISEHEFKSDFTIHQSKTQDIEISGKGSGLIQIIAEYSDDVDNRYSTIIQEIPIIVENGQRQIIPLAHTMMNRETELITAS